MAKAAKKVIITCAITGSIHTPSMSPHLPVTPQQIADNAIGAAEAGAICHRHQQQARPEEAMEGEVGGRKADFDAVLCRDEAGRPAERSEHAAHRADDE